MQIKNKKKTPSIIHGLPVVLVTLVGYFIFGYEPWTRWCKSTIFGEMTQGSIVDCFESGGYETILYHYQAPNGNNSMVEFQGENQIHLGCKKFHKGDSVNIYYSPSDPTISYLRGTNPLQSQWGAISAFGLVISLIMLIFLLLGVMRFSKSIGLWLKGND